MFLRPAVVAVLLVASFAAGAPSSSQDSDEVCGSHPCLSLIIDRAKDKTPKGIFSALCSSIDGIGQCAREKYDELVLYSAECEENTPYASAEIYANLKLKAIELAGRTICHMSFNDLLKKAMCVGSSIQTCWEAALESRPFELMDLYRRSPNTPSTTDMCGAVDSAYECTVDKVASRCHQDIASFSEELLEITIRDPFDYENNCQSEPDLVAALGNFGFV